MQRLFLAVLAGLVLIGTASAQWESPGSRAKSGQALYANKPNQYGGRQYAGLTPACQLEGGACAGTAYTADASWCGTMARFSSGSSITVTLPATLAPGCNILLEQDGAGKVSPSAASGASLHNRSGFTGSAGQYAVIGVQNWSNTSGTAAEWIMIGDGA